MDRSKIGLQSKRHDDDGSLTRKSLMYTMPEKVLPGLHANLKN
jgi:hypothetical protein